MKRAISVALGATKKRPLWQPGFFDHVLRNDESYSQKWEYVRENPVRAGLVSLVDDWPYRGEFVFIDRAYLCGRLDTGIVTRNRLVSGASGFSRRSSK